MYSATPGLLWRCKPNFFVPALPQLAILDVVLVDVSGCEEVDGTTPHVEGKEESDDPFRDDAYVPLSAEHGGAGNECRSVVIVG